MMEKYEIDDDLIVLQCDRTEFNVLCCGLNETLQFLEDIEFQTRTGVERDFVKSLLMYMIDKKASDLEEWANRHRLPPKD